LPNVEEREREKRESPLIPQYEEVVCRWTVVKKNIVLAHTVTHTTWKNPGSAHQAHFIHCINSSIYE